MYSQTIESLQKAKKTEKKESKIWEFVVCWIREAMCNRDEKTCINRTLNRRTKLLSIAHKTSI
jgi:hypothetical protein